TGDESRLRRGERDAQLGEEAGHLSEIVHLAPSGAEKHGSKREADCQRAHPGKGFESGESAGAEGFELHLGLLNGGRGPAGTCLAPRLREKVANPPWRFTRPGFPASGQSSRVPSTLRMPSRRPRPTFQATLPARTARRGHLRGREPRGPRLVADPAIP